MPDVSVFNLGGQNINVKDSTSRSSIETLNETVESLTDRVTQIEQSSKLTVSYNQANETITFAQSEETFLEVAKNG